MLNGDECNEFVGMCVDIGTKHYNVPDRFFYYTGLLKEVNDNVLKLKTRIGYKLIPLAEISEIRLSREGIH